MLCVASDQSHCVAPQTKPLKKQTPKSIKYAPNSPILCVLNIFTGGRQLCNTLRKRQINYTFRNASFFNSYLSSMLSTKRKPINNDIYATIAAQDSTINGYLIQNLNDVSVYGEPAGIDIFRRLMSSVCSTIQAAGPTCSQCVVNNAMSLTPPIDSFVTPFSDVISWCGWNATPNEWALDGAYWGTTYDVKHYFDYVMRCKIVFLFFFNYLAPTMDQTDPQLTFDSYYQ